VAVSQNIDFNVALGNLKQTYTKDLEDNRPAFSVLQELLPPNRDGIEVGDKLNIPVVLSHQGGESYGVSGSTANLRTPVAIEIKDAQTDQFEITQPVRMPFGMISKAQQSGKARFGDKARLLLLSGQVGAKRSLELSLLHGQVGLGKVSVVSAVTGAGPFSIDVTFTAQSWSDGVWGASDNLPYDFYSLITAGVKRNTGDCTVTAVDFANRKVTFQAPAAADLNTIAVNDVVFSAGAYSTTQMPGLMAIVSTVTGTLLNLPTSYSMWKAKQVVVNGPLTFGKIVSGISPAVSHGADGELTCLVSPKNWADLIKDLASARRLDSSYNEKTLKNGAQAIEYKYSGGKINVVLHPFMKDGEAVVIPVDNYFRVGSDPDPTMKLADLQLQVMSSTANVFEFRFWSASALIPNILGTSVYFSGITPNAS